MMTKSRQLSDLINMESPRAVLNEVENILMRISPRYDTTEVRWAFHATENLFQGRYPGYQACNTEYHNLRHTTDTFIAMARLIHGAFLEQYYFADHQIAIGLITALLHDSGYIQKSHDTLGTGAKYTANHVQRSIRFFETYANSRGFTQTDIDAGKAMILCTDLTVKIKTISFDSPEISLIGKMLGTADLLAQMAERTYLEKLLFLYYEFKEANVNQFKDSADLYQKTLEFYSFIAKRFTTDFDDVNQLMRPHFKNRWNIDVDLYAETLDKQKEFLKHILTDGGHPVHHLKRSGLIRHAIRKYGDPVKK